MIGVITALVVITFGIYAYSSMRAGGNIGVPIVAVIVGIFAIVATFMYLRNRFSEAERGMPLRDERSNKVMLIAGSKTFIISIWLLLILSFLSNDMIAFEDAGQALNIGIAGMAVIFGLSWLYYSKKEDLDKVKF